MRIKLHDDHFGHSRNTAVYSNNLIRCNVGITDPKNLAIEVTIWYEIRTTFHISQAFLVILSFCL
jgi:hypothetical protein